MSGQGATAPTLQRPAADLIAPVEEIEIAAAVGMAARRGAPLFVCGNGTKSGMLRPVQAARSLSTRDHTGITLYAPQGTGDLGPRRHAAGGDRSGGRRATASTSSPSRPTCPRCSAPTAPQTLGGVVADQPVRTAPRRLGRDARPCAGRARGERRGRGHPFRRPGAEERHRPGPVQAADRQPRHAGRDHRDHAEGAARAGDDGHAWCCPGSTPGRAWRRCRRRWARRSASPVQRGCRPDAAARVPALAGFGRAGGAGAHRGVRAVGRLSHTQAAAPISAWPPRSSTMPRRARCGARYATRCRCRPRRMTRFGASRCVPRPDRACCVPSRRRAFGAFSTGAAAWCGWPARRTRDA